MIEKHYDPENTDQSTNFSAIIMVGFRYELSDSATTSKGFFNFQLSNGETLELSGATASNLTLMDLIVAEPGVMIKEDSLYLFYTAAGSAGNQSIGLVRSTDGHNFIDTTLTSYSSY